MTVELKQNESLGPQAYAFLRQQIVRGAIAPGTKISEQEISRLLKISRQPVREAFIKLRNDNLVEVRPQRGTFATRIRLDAVQDARFIREAVEADIVKLLVSTCTDETVAKLWELIENQKKLKSSRAELFYELDEKFHRSLAEFAGKNTAWDVIASMKIHFDRVRHLSTLEKPLQTLIDQHEAIVVAIEQRDAAMADKAIRRHLREVLRDLSVIISKLPDYFSGSETVGSVDQGSSQE